MDEALVQIRYRVNVAGRLPDPQNKFRDSLEQTLEMTITGEGVDTLYSDMKIDAGKMRDYLFGALEERGGREYKVKK